MELIYSKESKFLNYKLAIIILSSIFLFTACNKTTPKCDSDEAKEKILQIYTQQVTPIQYYKDEAKQQENDTKFLDPKSFKLTNIQIISYDSTADKYLCHGDLSYQLTTLDLLNNGLKGVKNMKKIEFTLTSNSKDELLIEIWNR